MFVVLDKSNFEEVYVFGKKMPLNGRKIEGIVTVTLVTVVHYGI